MKQILSSTQIRDGVQKLAAQLREIYGDRPITIVAILTGSLVLLADSNPRARNAAPRGPHPSQPPSHARSNPARRRPIDDSILPKLNNRDVLVIDDIFDTGHTLVEVLAQLLRHEPKSLRSAVLMRKIGRSEVAIHPDIVMFDIPDEFVVGYGLDYEDRFRNLPYVAALEPVDLEAKTQLTTETQRARRRDRTNEH